MHQVITNNTGRYNDETSVKCSKCGWEGKIKDCIHGYKHYKDSNGVWDLEPTNYCLQCKMEV